MAKLSSPKLTDDDAVKLLRQWMEFWDGEDRPPSEVSIKTAIFLILNDHDDVHHAASEIIQA